MSRVALTALLAIVLADCGSGRTPMNQVEFLTSEGCVQTQIMRKHLHDAIQTLGAGVTYHLVDLDTLPASDVRRAYPTPTVLYGGVDLFGMTELKPPYPEPT